MPKSRLIGLVAVAFALIVAAVVLLNGFRLTETNPKKNATDVSVISPIVFTFSQALSSTTPTFTSSPPIDAELTINQKKLTLSPTQPFQPNTTYTVTLFGVGSASGAVIKSLKLSFTTTELSAEAVELRQQLPYSTSQFSVDYIESSQSYLVEVLTDPVEAAKSSALAFLATYGVTPSNSQISFYLIPGLSDSGSVGP